MVSFRPWHVVPAKMWPWWRPNNASMVPNTNKGWDMAKKHFMFCPKDVNLAKASDQSHRNQNDFKHDQKLVNKNWKNGNMTKTFGNHCP